MQYDAFDPGQPIAHIGNRIQGIAQAHAQASHAETLRQPRRVAAVWGFLHNRTMDDRTRTEIEAAVFRRLVDHFREHTDVKNIDVMQTAKFCRNCLSKWYRAAAAERGLELEDAQAREIVYGMPYEEWKAKHQ